MNRLGILNKNVNKLNIGRSAGASWSSYWKSQSEVIFFASDPTDLLANKVIGGKLYNQVNGSSDYLTVTGSGLNAVYTTPNTTPYKNADTDYCWWKIDGTQSTTDGNRLIAYDFTRTIVKYLDVSPYTITAIMILSSTESSGSAKENKMRDDFHLSIWWSNVLSNHGYTKGNRDAEKLYWIPAPSSLALTVNSATDISGTFADMSSNESGFKLERSLTDETNYTVIQTLAANATSFDDSICFGTSKYYYRLRAYISVNGGNQYSAYCASANATTPAAYDSASLALFAAKLSADGVAYTDAEKATWDTAIKALKNASLWSTQFDVLVVPRSNGLGGSMLNIINPGTCNGERVANGGTLTHTDNVGDHSDGTKSYIRSHYNPDPAANGVLFVQNSACFGFKVSGSITNGGNYHGMLSAVPGSDGNVEWGDYFGTNNTRLNNTTTAGVGSVAFAAGYNCLSRAVAGSFQQMVNSNSTDANIASATLTGAQELYMLAVNYGGAAAWCVSTVVLELYWMGATMTQNQFNTFQGIWNTFFSNYS
jgi:hypothetical protein